MLKLKTIPPPPTKPVYKASVHRTGRIGLTGETAKIFGFSTEKSIELMINEGDPNDSSVYGILREAGAVNTYKIMKAGEYHSINSKGFFDALNWDYTNEYIGFKVSKIDVNGQEVLKFQRITKESGLNAGTSGE